MRLYNNLTLFLKYLDLFHRLVQFDYCEQKPNSTCLKNTLPGLHEDILKSLKRLSFTSVPGYEV